MNLRDDLKAYLDGELEPLRAEEVKIALERDPALRRELAQLKALSTGLREFASDYAPKGLDDTLAALKLRSRKKTLVWTRCAWGGGLALAAVLVGVVLMPGLSREDGADTTSAKSAMVAKNDSGNRDLSVETPESILKIPSRSPDANLSKPQIQKSQSTGTIPLNAPKWAASETKSSKPPVILNRSNANTSYMVKEPTLPTVALKSQSVSSPATSSTFGLDTKRAHKAIDSDINGSDIGDLHEGAETVAFSFKESDPAIQKVHDLVTRFEVAQGPVTKSNPSLSVSVGEQRISIEIPDDDADKILGELRALQTQSEPPAPSRGIGGGFGGGGVGGIKSTPDDGKEAARKQGPASRGKTLAPGPESKIEGSKAVDRSVIADSTVQSSGVSKAHEKKATSRSDGFQPHKMAGAVTLGSSFDAAKKRKTRRVIIVITVRPKQQSVP